VLEEALKTDPHDNASSAPQAPPVEDRPRKPFQKLRGFLKEYSIIVLSVLTALGLEQAVVWIHHRSQVDEAIHRMRAESIENRAALKFSIANMRDGVKAIDARLDILGNCTSPVASGQLAAVTPSTTLLPSDTAWLGVRDSALLPLMPKAIADNYWKLNMAYSLMVPDLEDVIGRTDDARAAVELVRRGVGDRQACVGAVQRLLRMRASLKTLWRQLAFYQSGNEQVLRGERLGVGTAVQAVRDAGASLKGN
jgi:hypothetical protein